MEALIVITVGVIAVFAAWTAFCLLLKGMFKIADWVFGF